MLRFLALVVVVLAAYFAQYLFDYRSLEQFFLPSGIRNRVLIAIPALSEFALWHPNDLISLALWIAFIASISFGLIAPQWNQFVPAVIPVRTNLPSLPDKNKRRRLWLPFILLIVASMLAAYVFGYLGAGSAEGDSLQSLWIISILLYLIGGFLLDRVYGVGLSTPQSVERVTIQPYRSWPRLLFILIGAGYLFTWQLADIPVRIDEKIASIGLQALAISTGQEGRLFSLGWENVPLLAYQPAALGIWLTGDPLLGIRVIGPLSGLFLVVGTWLLGCELFRRRPYLNPSNHLSSSTAPSNPIFSQSIARSLTLRDDGRSLALLASALIAVGQTMIHFSRMPFYLEPVAWGAFGAWCLLRGLRLNQRFLLALSGIAIGLVVMLYQSGLSLFLTLLVWWICLSFSQKGWSSRRAGGVNALGFLIWIGAIFVVIAPFVGTWAYDIDIFYRYFQSGTLFASSMGSATQGMEIQSADIGTRYLDNLISTILTFNLYPDVSAIFGYPNHLLDSLFAPLLILGVGCLFFNLNRQLGWLLLTGFVITVFGSATSLDAPFWPRLLPALPIVALTISFAIDRIHMVFLLTIGLWTRNILSLLTIGLLFWGAIQNWVNYHDFATGEEDITSYVGRISYQAQGGQAALYLVNSNNFPDSSLFKFLSSRTISNGQPSAIVQTIQSDAWPESLPSRSWILVHAAESSLLPMLQQQYPGGTLETERDQQANPLFYIYHLP